MHALHIANISLRYISAMEYLIRSPSVIAHSKCDRPARTLLPSLWVAHRKYEHRRRPQQIFLRNICIAKSQINMPPPLTQGRLTAAASHRPTLYVRIYSVGADSISAREGNASCKHTRREQAPALRCLFAPHICLPPRGRGTTEWWKESA